MEMLLLVAYLAAGTVLYGVLLAIYRLTLHPLARFPGPKLAAATGWYEFYYNIVKMGTFIYKVDEMHKRYGRIVRINPHEIVINDAEFYNQIYNMRPAEKWTLQTSGIGIDGKIYYPMKENSAHVVTTNHELHRHRRKPLDPFFSRRGIERIEPVIVDEVKLLNDRLQSYSGTGHVIRLDHVFAAFAGDIVMEICTQRRPAMLENPEFGKEWNNLMLNGTKQSVLFLHFPLLNRVVRRIPTALLLRLAPSAATFNLLHQHAIKHIVDVKRDITHQSSSNKDKDTTGSRLLRLDTSVFRSILSPTSGLPPPERNTERLAREAMALFGAGTLTTAHTLNMICYYLLANRAMGDRLRGELAPVMAGFPESKLASWQELERLPYLHAVVREGLRLSYGVMHRLPRVFSTPTQYKEWTIPAGTPIGIGAYSLHSDPDVYSDPFSFTPERWLGDAVDPRLHRNWVTFSRGSRSCLGLNLAYAELYWALAVLFRPGAPKLSLFETVEEDVKHVLDLSNALPRWGSLGTRVTVG
ncbi:hypothetical protein BDW74DRAFT_175104 [Aspergillus multicolor]|uniref:cytochrome P450 n=1 Tax=Aspergillus multicolor TaxID=41759 RepID=UPI003CCE2D3F